MIEALKLKEELVKRSHEPAWEPVFPVRRCFFACSKAVTVWDGGHPLEREAGVYIEPATGETGPIFAFKDAKPHRS